MSISQFKVLVTRNIPSSALKILRKGNCLLDIFQSDEPITRWDLLTKIKEKDALFCLLTDRIDNEVLDSAGPQLKVIGTMSVGYDHLDIDAIRSRKIRVGYTPNILNAATAELAVSLLLSCSRQIPQGIRAVKEGEWSSWKPLWMCGQGLSGSTVGIVGLGGVGLGIAQRLKSFDIKKLLYSASTPKPLDSSQGAIYSTFDNLLSESDFVIAACALNHQTKGMFNIDAFRKMKPTSIFINISRGPVVNQDDLYHALSNNLIASAGLDVTSPEPLPVDHPLLSLDNCIVLPHIGSATVDTRTAMAELTSHNILAALRNDEMPAELGL